MNARHFRTAGKAVWYRVFRLLQRIGVNVLPHHFYSGVPDIADLERRSDWRGPRSMRGIACRDVASQLELLSEWLAPHAAYLRDHSIHREAVHGGGIDGGYGEIESEVLFAFAGTCKPARIVQVGCGVSTAVMLMAAQRAGYTPDIVCVEPFPSAYLRAAQTAGKIRMIEKPAQLVGCDTLTGLGAGDLLFVDSTHAVKPGSEVNYLIHEVLPRLSPGVLVHFHDIYFPYDYARDLLNGDLLFPQESALLYAFLTGNRSYRLEASLSMIHYADPAGLQRLLPDYRPAAQVNGLAAATGDASGRHFPSAAYMRVIG
jgi:hypothetical protein